MARLREFYREPEAVFWVYGFPILLMVGLGIAFRNQPVEKITVDVAGTDRGPKRSLKRLAANDEVRGQDRARTEQARLRLAHRQDRSRGRSPADELGSRAYEYRLRSARDREPAGAQRRRRCAAAGRRTQGRGPTSPTHEFNEPGGRYIDFLVPGLLGMSLMGGGLWGVGFVTVDMRIRKLLKRFLATPMRESDFLAGVMISRLLFMVPEVLVLLLFARLVFGVVIYGSLLAVLVPDPAGRGRRSPAWACLSPAGRRRWRPSRA